MKFSWLYVKADNINFVFQWHEENGYKNKGKKQKSNLNCHFQYDILIEIEKC